MLSLGALVIPRSGCFIAANAAHTADTRYDRKLWIVEPVTPAAYPPA